jgi:putative YphP/YqiW family bacilliredoxin
MPYSELMIRPFREELTRLGVEELRTPQQVDEALSSDGTVMVVVNSVCGCAAGRARPGVALALQHDTRPDRVTTVFAGADIEATDLARTKYFQPFQPSSPQIALVRDGKTVYMLERHQIERRSAEEIAALLTQAFDEHCSKRADEAAV